MLKLWSLILLATALLARCAGGESAPLEPISEVEAERIKAELADRTFRQFEPLRDADRRKAVVLDFFSGVSLRAQSAEGGHAVSEWEIVASDYRVERAGAASVEITITFADPRTRQQFPEACENCIDTSGVSISIRNLFDAERNVFDEGRIAFRLNDPEGVLPAPFPIFGSWTVFEEVVWFW